MKYFKYFLIGTTIYFLNIILYYNDYKKLSDSFIKEKLILLQTNYNPKIMFQNKSLTLVNYNTSTNVLSENSQLYSFNLTEKSHKINVSYGNKYEKVNINKTYINHKKNKLYSEIQYAESNAYSLTKQYESLSNYLENIYKNIKFFKKKRTIVIVIIERNRNLEFDILRSLIRAKESCSSLYKIVHVEQSKNCLFNRGLLANVGFAKAYDMWDDIERIVIHDTDMFPESTMCYNEPYHAPVIHYATRVSQFDDKLPYKTYFGGVIGFIPSVYKKINGFSNSFWGWGGEDDDIYNRVVNTGFNVFSSASGRFLSTCHERDKTNVKRNVEILNDGSRTNDGLSNLNDIVNPIVTKLSNDEVHVVVDINSTFCKNMAPSSPTQIRQYYESSYKNIYNEYSYKNSYTNSHSSYKDDKNTPKSYGYENKLKDLQNDNHVTISRNEKQNEKKYRAYEKINKNSKKTSDIF